MAVLVPLCQQNCFHVGLRHTYFVIFYAQCTILSAVKWSPWLFSKILNYKRYPTKLLSKLNFINHRWDFGLVWVWCWKVSHKNRCKPNVLLNPLITKMSVLHTHTNEIHLQSQMSLCKKGKKCSLYFLNVFCSVFSFVQNKVVNSTNTKKAYKLVHN